MHSALSVWLKCCSRNYPSISTFGQSNWVTPLHWKFCHYLLILISLSTHMTFFPVRKIKGVIKECQNCPFEYNESAHWSLAAKWFSWFMHIMYNTHTHITPLMAKTGTGHLISLKMLQLLNPYPFCMHISCNLTLHAVL